jgi:putative DNA primase/helicase
VSDEREQTIRPRAHLTDVGNGQRFALQHGAWVRYCWPWHSWLLWTGTHWQRDPGNGVLELAKATAKAIYLEAGGAATPDDRDRLARWAAKSENEKLLRSMLALAQSEPGIPVLPEDLDTDPWALNLTNGTLDLKSGTLRPHHRDDRITKCIPVAYDPAAGCPQWLAVLGRIFDGRAPLITFLQRALGYSLTGDCSEQVLFVLWGSGANGKTTLLTTAVTMMGDYALSTRPETLMVKKGDQIPNDVARLRGARLVIAVEADGGQRLAEGLVKQMTGQDRMSARFMRQEYFDFTPNFKVFLATNHKPLIRDTTHSMWRRVRLLPFSVTIPDQEQDHHLTDKLRAEWPGILAWAVRGCLDWQREGLGLPDEVKTATEAYRAEMDTLGEFLREECVLEAGAQVLARALYQRYDTWAFRTGEKKPLSQKALSLALAERGLTKRHTEKGAAWTGLRERGLTDAPPPDWVTEP